MWKYYVPKELNLESVILLNCIVGSYASMSENKGGLWTLQVTVREFDSLIVSVYCQVSLKLSLVLVAMALLCIYYSHVCC